MANTKVVPIGCATPIGKKICLRCSTLRSINEFYLRKDRPGKRFPYCRSCLGVRGRSGVLAKLVYKVNSPDYIREKDARRLSRHPEKVRAKQLATSVKVTKGNQRHHWSYNTEHIKDIIELTHNDHGYIHRHIQYDKGSMMYRTKEGGVLLDNREKHEAFIRSKLAERIA